MKRILLALLVLLAVVLVACNGDAAGSPSGAASQASEEATEPSEDDGGDDSGPSMQAGAGDLDAVLPDEVSGIPIEYESTTGEEVFSSDDMTPEAQAFLDEVGATSDNVSSAFGFGSDTEGGRFLTILAFRVQGADEGRLRDAFRNALLEENPEMETSDENVAGKDVVAFTDPETADSTGYIYVNNDIVFLVGAVPMDLAEEALQQLP